MCNREIELKTEFTTTLRFRSGGPIPPPHVPRTGAPANGIDGAFLLLPLLDPPRHHTSFWPPHVQGATAASAPTLVSPHPPPPPRQPPSFSPSPSRLAVVCFLRPLPGWERPFPRSAGARRTLSAPPPSCGPRRSALPPPPLSPRHLARPRHPQWAPTPPMPLPPHPAGRPRSGLLGGSHPCCRLHGQWRRRWCPLPQAALAWSPSQAGGQWRLT